MLTSINEVDVPIMKLDVGSPEKFDRINRPTEIQFEELIEGLEKVENLQLQSIKIKGEFATTGGPNLQSG